MRCKRLFLLPMVAKKKATSSCLFVGDSKFVQSCCSGKNEKSLGRHDLPGCLDWYILNHSGPCPCDCNPHGLFCAFSGRPTNARRWQPTWRSFDEVPLSRAASLVTGALPSFRQAYPPVYPIYPPPGPLFPLSQR